jgi:hypothetical protein
MMNEETLEKIGLTKSDFDEELKSESDLISSVSTSGRLYRKAIQYIILKELRIYLDNPHLNYSDDISQYFKYKGRKKRWTKFRDWMGLKTPELRVENFAIFLMVAYLLGYGYYVLKFLFNNTDFLTHVSMSGLSLSGLFLLGALAPLVVIFHMGKTELPAKSVDGLVDKIIQENMHDLLTDDRENLKEIIRKEIKVE